MKQRVLSVIRHGMQAKEDEDPHGLLGIHRSEWLVDGVDLPSFTVHSTARSSTADLQRHPLHSSLLPSHLSTRPTRGEAAPQMEPWGSGALEQLALQVHLHLSCCSAALPGIFFVLCDSLHIRSPVTYLLRHRADNLAWEDDAPPCLAGPTPSASLLEVVSHRTPASCAVPVGWSAWDKENHRLSSGGWRTTDTSCDCCSRTSQDGRDMELQSLPPGVPGLFRGGGRGSSHGGAGFSHPAPPLSRPSFQVDGLDGDWAACSPLSSPEKQPLQGFPSSLQKSIGPLGHCT